MYERGRFLGRCFRLAGGFDQRHGRATHRFDCIRMIPIPFSERPEEVRGQLDLLRQRLRGGDVKRREVEEDRLVELEVGKTPSHECVIHCIHQGIEPATLGSRVAFQGIRCRRQDLLYFADVPRVPPVKYSPMVSTPIAIVWPIADFIDRIELGHCVSKGDRRYPEGPATLRLNQYRFRRFVPQDTRWSLTGKLDRQSREGVVGSKRHLGARAPRRPLLGTANPVTSSSSSP